MPNEPAVTVDPAPVASTRTDGSQAYRAAHGPVVPGQPGPVWTIGNFDGVHRGHRALLARARALAGRGPVCALTFDPSPRTVLRPDTVVPAIQSLDDRVRTLVEAGADHVVVEPFDRSYAGMDALTWARDVLVERLRASAVVVGWDFRFGRGRSGGLEALRAVVSGPVEQVGGVTWDGVVVSSTRIRAAIADGRVADAAAWLARPHELVGPVVPGDGRGRTVGIPTANVAYATELVPPPGVYAVRAWIDGAWRDASGDNRWTSTSPGGTSTAPARVSRNCWR